MENAPPGKKRKLGFQNSELSIHSLFQPKAQRLAVVTPANSLDCEYSICQCVICSDHVVVPTVCSSQVEKIQKGNIIDEETGDSLDCRERSETSVLLIEGGRAESGELESTARPPESNSRRPEKIMPSQDELEEFFVGAEKNLQKKFIDMYNFDIAKDEPLEGRYEWVHIQSKPS